MTRCNNITNRILEIKCRNTAVIGERCNEHLEKRLLKLVTTPDIEEVAPDVLPMTPQQKAAKTRAARKAKLKKEMDDLDCKHPNLSPIDGCKECDKSYDEVMREKND